METSTEKLLEKDHLHKNSIHIRSIINMINLSAYVVNYAGEILFTNRNFQFLIQSAENDLIGKNFLEITTPTSRMQSEKMFQRIRNNEIEHYRIFKEFNTTSDKAIPVSLFVTGLKITLNTRYFLSVVTPEMHDCYCVHDIDKGLQSFKQLLDNLPIGVVALSSGGKLYYQNFLSQSLIGYKRNINKLYIWNIVRNWDEAFFFTIANTVPLCKLAEYPIQLISESGTIRSYNAWLFSMYDTLLKEEAFFLCFNAISSEKNIDIIRSIHVEKLTEVHNFIGEYLKLLPTGQPKSYSEIISRFKLTEREKSILFSVLQHKTTKEIAGDLNLAEITIRKHLTQLYRKFTVSGREELIAFFQY